MTQMSLFGNSELDRCGDDHTMVGAARRKPRAKKPNPAATFVVEDPEAVVRLWLEQYSKLFDQPPTCWELACESDPVHSGNPRMSPGDAYDVIDKVTKDSKNGVFICVGERRDRLTGVVCETWQLAGC